MSKGILAVISLVFLAVVGAGAYFFLVVQPNKPDVRYILMPNVKSLSEEKQKALESDWQAIVAADTFMTGLVKQTKIDSKWGLSPEAAIKELRERVHIKITRKDGLQVGFKGKRKEKSDLDELSQTLFMGGAQLLSQKDPEYSQLFKGK